MLHSCVAALVLAVVDASSYEPVDTQIIVDKDDYASYDNCEDPGNCAAPCASPQTFHARMCDSWMCTMCPSDWCRESCQKLQADYPTCRCPDWPDHKMTYTADDIPPVTGCVMPRYTVTPGKHCGGGTLNPLQGTDGGELASYGWDPGSDKVTSAKECEAKCLDSPRCGGFVWRDENPRPSGSTQGCFWKEQDYSPNTMEYHDCHELTNGPCGFTVHKQRHCGGSTINGLDEDHPYGWQPSGEGWGMREKIEACEQACNDHDNCAGFVWRYDDGNSPEGCFWKAGPLNLSGKYPFHDCYVKPNQDGADVRSLLDQGGGAPTLVHEKTLLSDLANVAREGRR